MRTKTKIKYLEKARDLISNKETWCQGADARNKDGLDVSPYERRATQFCARGAIFKAVGDLGVKLDALRSFERYRAAGQKKTDLMNLLNDSCVGHKNIMNCNDNKSTGHSHRRVINVFNRAIKKLQKQLEQGK